MNRTININQLFKAITLFHEPPREASPVKNSRGKGRARIKDIGEDMDGTSFQSIGKEEVKIMKTEHTKRTGKTNITCQRMI